MVNGIATLYQPHFHNENCFIHQSTNLDSNRVQVSRRHLALIEYLSTTLSKWPRQQYTEVD